MKPSTRDTLARVASIYRNAVADGKSPVDAVARDLDITANVAKQRIHRTRRAGLLNPEEHDYQPPGRHGRRTTTHGA